MKLADLTELQRDLLTESVYDYYGLWEVPMFAREYYPQMDEDNRVREAKRQFEEMFSLGLVTLYKGSNFPHDAAKIPEADAWVALRDGGNWRWDSVPPVQIRFSASTYGENIYYGKDSGTSPAEDRHSG